jgi:hypothetical protein
MRYRVIQWATGGVGRAAIEGVVSHPELELVGCWVHSRSKAGRDAGEIAGIGALGETTGGHFHRHCRCGAEWIEVSQR